MRILVTGASGFIGGVLCAGLRSRGHDVIALVRSAASEPPGIRSATGLVKVSRFTSRQPPHSFEMASNWVAIQSAAAVTPVPWGRSVSMLERVLRVPKLTSFSIV